MVSSTVWIALFCYPLVVMVLFGNFKLPVATCAAFIAGYLLLPDGQSVDFPALPPLDKNSIPALSVFVMILLASRDPVRARMMLPGWLPRDKIALLLMLMLVLGAFGTVFTNADNVYNGAKYQRGLRSYDAFSVALSIGIMLLPMLIARKVLSTPEAIKTLMRMLVGAAVLYSFLALWEVRMSPQLNADLYGFFPHAWIQHNRGGGFRPIVFLHHGLILGIFFATATVLAFGMGRLESGGVRTKLFAAGTLLLLTLSVSKVLGAMMIVFVFVPVVLFLSRRVQVWVAFCFGVVVLFYPIFRNADVLPIASVVSLAETINPNRADSLEFRLRNEDKLLERARERPMFGWGGWGRNRIYNHRGKDISTTDGRWIILFGQGGWVRYLGEFGLLLLVILRLPFFPRDRLDPFVVVMAVALTANLVDLLPNSGVTVLTWMLAGSLLGFMENKEAVRQDTPDPVPSSRKNTRYARDFGPPKQRRTATDARADSKPLRRPKARGTDRYSRS